MPDNGIPQNLLKDAAAIAIFPSTIKGGIFTYSRSKGLFAGIGLKGIAISPSNEANKAYYGSDLSVRDILMHGKAKPSEEAEGLIRIISANTK